MGKYNEIGVDKKGNVDPVRKMVHEMVGLMGSPYGGSGTREMADDLYSWMKKNKGGKDDGKDDDKKGQNSGGRPPIKDVDFGMDGKPTYTNPLKKFDKDEAIKDLIGDPRDPNRFKMGKGIIPKNPLKVSGATTMKQGGLVRGAGCAQRGRGKGKMV